MNNGTAKNSFRLKTTSGEIVFQSSKQESHRDSSMVNKADWGAVPQFLFPRNPGPDYTCGHLHCHE